MSYRNQIEADQARMDYLLLENEHLEKENARLKKEKKALECRPVQIKHVHPPEPPGDGIPIGSTDRTIERETKAITLGVGLIFLIDLVATLVLRFAN